MRHVLCAGTQMEHRKNLGARVDGQPEPQHLCGAAQPGAQFVQLQVRELEMAEEALVQGVCVLASTGEPGGDGGLSEAEDPLGRGRVQPFGQRREHHGDLVGRGFQTIQGRVASGTEGGAAGLAAKGLDALGMAMLAIANQRMDVSVGDPEVQALLVGTGEALGVHPLGCSPAAFHLTPGTHSRGAGSPPDEGVEARRQAGQSSGERGSYNNLGGARQRDTPDGVDWWKQRESLGRGLWPVHH